MIFERLSWEDFGAPKVDYKDVNKLHNLYDSYDLKYPTILCGPKGCGKSLSVAAYANIKNIPLVTFDCSEDVRRSNLIGSFILKGDQTPFVLGPLTTAFEIANERGKCILLLEEINSLTPQVQKVLNGATDFRAKVEVPEIKRVFRLQGSKLWIVGTMNPAYQGTYELNTDLRSRFRIIPVNYPSKKVELDLLKSTFTTVQDDLLNSAIQLAEETRQGAFEYSLSTRDLVQFIQDQEVLGTKKALWVLSGKFEQEERKTIAKRMSSIFIDA